jgi:uncharacterized membrane protein YdjX (TVP38/TMEM64 family)
MRARGPLLVALACLLGLGALGWGLAQTGLGRILTDRAVLQEAVAALGPWGPLVVILAEIAQVLLAPIPGQVVGVAAGYLYGVGWGTALCSLGLALGTAAALGLGRAFGRPLVERYASPTLIARLDSYARQRGVLAFLLIFLLPFLPDDLCCFVAGLTLLPLGELWLVALVGRLPGVIVSTLIGAQAHTLTTGQLALIGGGSVLLALLAVRYQRQLEERAFTLLDHFLRRAKKEG